MQSVMQDVLEQLSQVAGGYALNLLAAIVILVVGWIVARVAGAIVRGALNKTTLDNRLVAWVMGPDETEGRQPVQVEYWTGRVVFYVIMLFVLVAFFQVLDLTLVTEPLNRLLTDLAQFAPKLLGAAVLLGLAWLLATGLRLGVRRGFAATRLDDRLGGEVSLEGEKQLPLSKVLSDAVYWLVFLLFLPAIVGALGLGGLLAPVQALTERILGFLPNVFGAALILAAGWLVARIVQRIVTNLLAAVGADRVTEQLGIPGKTLRLSSLAGIVTYVLILVPVVIAALNALRLEAITRPASDMLSRLLDAVPALFAAALVLLIAYAVGRWVTAIASQLLAAIGFDRVLTTIGLRSEKEDGGAGRSPSEIAGYVLLVAIMLFASIEASRLLGFAALANALMEFTSFSVQVLLGLAIFGVGLYLANVAGRVVSASSAREAPILATAARVSILVLAGAMALRQMGLANEIVELAFGLLIGSIAVAVALAFGLGSRDIAARHLERWLESANLSSSDRGSSGAS